MKKYQRFLYIEDYENKEYLCVRIENDCPFSSKEAINQLKIKYPNSKITSKRKAGDVIYSEMETHHPIVKELENKNYFDFQLLYHKSEGWYIESQTFNNLNLWLGFTIKSAIKHIKEKIKTNLL